VGAFQANSLESNLNYLRIARENVIGSESVIRDADMADEMMQNTRNQIMLQSSTAMLVQANQNPQRVLQLLGKNSRMNAPPPRFLTGAWGAMHIPWHWEHRVYVLPLMRVVVSFTDPISSLKTE